MEGSNTLVCDGDKWNGTVPDRIGKLYLSTTHLNLRIIQLNLMIVSGSVVTTVKPGVQQSTRLEYQSLQPFSTIQRIVARMYEIRSLAKNDSPSSQFDLKP